MGAPSTVTCHTEGCANAGAPIELNLWAMNWDTGEETPIEDVFCGVCGERITDVTAPPS